MRKTYRVGHNDLVSREGNFRAGGARKNGHMRSAVGAERSRKKSFCGTGCGIMTWFCVSKIFGPVGPEKMVICDRSAFAERSCGGRCPQRPGRFCAGHQVADGCGQSAPTTPPSRLCEGGIKHKKTPRHHKVPGWRLNRLSLRLPLPGEAFQFSGRRQPCRPSGWR